jgi:hypothetical protein
MSYPPSFTAAKLYRKTSKTGSTYYVGRLGGIKVAVVKSNETVESGDEVWNLLFSEAAPYQSSAAEQQPKPEYRKRSVSDQQRRDYAKPADAAAPARPLVTIRDDEIPF